VRLKGAVNGDLCSNCIEYFHHVCMYLDAGKLYCTTCYKSEVVSRVVVTHSFGRLFGRQMRSDQTSVPLPSKDDLHNFLTKELCRLGFKGKFQTQQQWKEEFERKRKQLHASVKTASGEAKRRATEALKKHLRAASADRSGYLECVKQLVKLWLESTPSVVVALRYDSERKCFYAKTQYQNGRSEDDIKTQTLEVADDWVFDNYGKGLAAKLIDRAESEEFVPVPSDSNEPLAEVMLDQKRIVRVKYRPAKSASIKAKKGDRKQVMHAISETQLHDGSVISAEEKALVEQFGKTFVTEVKNLGIKKYVPIPVGSCRRSVVELMPCLRHDEAPPVKYMQGDKDTCVFSSFASALHSSGDKELQQLAQRVSAHGARHEGGASSLEELRKLVVRGARWLQPKATKKEFCWHQEIGPGDFFVGIMRDSTGSVQHAVSVHKSWVFDSNEPCALPLNKESLDCCTWEVENGEVKERSEFVHFERGILFQNRRKAI